MTGLMERRRVSWKRLFTRHFIWLPVIPLLVAAVLGAFSWHQLRTAELLEIYGIEAIATVVDRDIRRTRDSEGRTRTEYRISYRFQPTTGPEISTRRNVSRATYDALPSGAEVTVRYVEHDPGVNEIEPGNAATTGLIAALVATTAGIVGLGLTLWIARRKASLFRAARHGEVRQARVTGREETNTRVNGRRQYRLTWVDALGHEGRSGHFRYERLPPEGSVIVVYIDGKTGRSWWDEEI